MEAYIGIGVLILSIWVLWKTRRIIWFFVLFIIALIFILGVKLGVEWIVDDSPEIGLLLLVGGATITAFKFAKKRY